MAHEESFIINNVAKILLVHKNCKAVSGLSIRLLPKKCCSVYFMMEVLTGLFRPSISGERRSSTAIPISASSRASSGVMQPTVTISQSRRGP